MIIDSHQHVLSDCNYQLHHNMACGIEKVILFPTIVHPEKAGEKAGFVEEMSKLQMVLKGAINPIEIRKQAIMEMVNIVSLKPEFYIGFAPCPFGMDYENTADWIETVIIKNNCRGIGELTFGTGNVPFIENIFKCIHDRQYDLPIWIHTFDPLTLGDIKAIVDLASKYPLTKVILGHGGGRNWIETIDLVKNCSNIFVDISAAYTIFSLKFITQELPERCVFSSDFPYGDPYLGISQIEYLIMDRSIRKNLLGLNIQQLLKL